MANPTRVAGGKKADATRDHNQRNFGKITQRWKDEALAVRHAAAILALAKKLGLGKATLALEELVETTPSRPVKDRAPKAKTGAPT